MSLLRQTHPPAVSAERRARLQTGETTALGAKSIFRVQHVGWPVRPIPVIPTGILTSCYQSKAETLANGLEASQLVENS